MKKDFFSGLAIFFAVEIVCIALFLLIAWAFGNR
jgi:hypothetical protein